MIDFSSRPGWAPVPHEVRQDDPGWQLIQLPGIRLSVWRSFACGTLVDEAADGPYMPRS